MTFNLDALFSTNENGTPLLGVTFKGIIDLMSEFGQNADREPKQRPPC
jgi:hypothetical protein